MKARYLPYPSISANISLSLVPVSNMNQDAPTGEQCITWIVNVKVNGASIEIMSGAEAMYLFWESQYVLHRFVSS